MFLTGLNLAHSLQINTQSNLISPLLTDVRPHARLYEHIFYFIFLNICTEKKVSAISEIKTKSRTEVLNS